MFDKLFFQSKFVFRGGPSYRPKSVVTKQELKESDEDLKSETTKAKLELATLARRQSFGDMLIKLVETNKDAHFYAAVDWAVKPNSPFYAKRDKILRALRQNDDFFKTVPAQVCVQKFDVFNEANVKALLKGLSGRWIMKGMVKMTRPKLPGLVKLMRPELKAQLKVIAQAGIKKYLRKAQSVTPSSIKAVNYTKNLNKYQKILDALEGKIQTKPASTTNTAVRTVPYRPPKTNQPTRTDSI